MTRFIHTGDTHLGNEQYGMTERADDFNNAFLKVVDHACLQRVDFVLITGDLLHKASQSDALALLQANAGLERLRSAGIPVVAIEGNHELQQRADSVSFPQYFNVLKLIYLLDVETNQYGDPILFPWNPTTCTGGYVDIGRTRIYGIRYMGAQTARALEEIAGQIDRGDSDFVILMLHTGMEGEIPHMHGGLTMTQLAPLKGKVDYVALGHVHKKLERENWIFNPGSTEICSMDEIGPEWPHGFFEVEVVNGRARVQHHLTATRAFVRLQINIEGCESPEAVVARARDVINGETHLPEGSVVEVTMTGLTPFNRHEISEQLIKAAVETRCHPLTVKIRYSVSPLSVGLDRSQHHASRHELEQEVVEHIIRQHPAYERQSREWTAVTLDVKQMVIEGRPPGAIAEHVRQSHLRLENATSLLTEGAGDERPQSEPVEQPVEDGQSQTVSRQLGLPV